MSMSYRACSSPLRVHERHRNLPLACPTKRDDHVPRSVEPHRVQARRLEIEETFEDTPLRDIAEGAHADGGGFVRVVVGDQSVVVLGVCGIGSVVAKVVDDGEREADCRGGKDLAHHERRLRRLCGRCVAVAAERRRWVAHSVSQTGAPGSAPTIDRSSSVSSVIVSPPLGR